MNSKELYRVRYLYKPYHNCPTCRCEPRESIRVFDSEEDAKDWIRDTLNSREMRHNAEISKVKLEKTSGWEDITPNGIR